MLLLVDDIVDPVHHSCLLHNFLDHPKHHRGYLPFLLVFPLLLLLLSLSLLWPSRPTLLGGRLPPFSSCIGFLFLALLHFFLGVVRGGLLVNR